MKITLWELKKKVQKNCFVFCNKSCCPFCCRYLGYPSQFGSLVLPQNPHGHQPSLWTWLPMKFLIVCSIPVAHALSLWKASICRPARLLVSHFHKYPDEYPLPYIKFRQAIYHWPTDRSSVVRCFLYCWVILRDFCPSWRLIVVYIFIRIRSEFCFCCLMRRRIGIAVYAVYPMTFGNLFQTVYMIIIKMQYLNFFIYIRSCLLNYKFYVLHDYLDLRKKRVDIQLNLCRKYL